MSLPVTITFTEAFEKASVYDEVGGRFCDDELEKSIYKRAVGLNDKIRTVADQDDDGTWALSISAERKTIENGEEKVVEVEDFYHFDTSVSTIEFPK